MGFIDVSLVLETLRKSVERIEHTGQHKVTFQAAAQTANGHKFVPVNVSFTLSANAVSELAEDAGVTLTAKPKKAPKE